jgi:hypothetical protein
LFVYSPDLGTSAMSLLESRLIAEIRSQSAEIRSLKERTQYVLSPAVVGKAKSVMFYLLSSTDAPTPVASGFFFAPLRALTVHHSIRDRCLSSSGVLRGVALDGTHHSFRILCDNQHLDFTVLELAAGSARPFFELTGAPAPPMVGAKAVLLACGIAMSRDSVPELEGQPSLTVVQAAVTLHGPSQRHFSYDAPTYGGDSGGCLIFGDDGHVVGMHVAGVNDLQQQEEFSVRQSPTRRRKPDDDSARASLRDIIENLNTGGIALFLGVEEVRNAVSGMPAPRGAGVPGAVMLPAAPLTSSGHCPARGSWI